MKVLLCHPGHGCPAVEFRRDQVIIGEKGNTVRLSVDEWNELVSKILSGQLKSL